MDQFRIVKKEGLLLAVRGGLLFLFAELAVLCLSASDSAVSDQLLLRAVSILVLAVFLAPQQEPGKRSQFWLITFWSLLSGVGVIAGCRWVMVPPAPYAVVLPLALGTVALVLVFSCLTQLLACRLNDRRIAARASLITLLYCLTLPLWAAPIVAFYGSSKLLVDTVVALCPVSYLAQLAQIDFLRGNWLYVHTPYGSLRFDYPDPVHATFLILGLASIFLTITLAGNSRSGRQPPESVSFNSQKQELEI